MTPSSLWRLVSRLARPGGATDLEAGDRELPIDFDPERYLDLNPDLERFRGRLDEAVTHFLKHGRGEARRYRSTVERLEIDHGQLPADFDPDAYIDLHPDLEAFRDAGDRAAEHFLQSGRREGRAYKRLSVEALARRPAGAARADDEEKAARPDRRLWTNRFSVAEFRALHPDLGPRITSREEGLHVFLQEGVARGLPLSFTDRFDPDFYRARYPDVAALPPVEAYRHWLFEGLPDRRPGSRAELCRDLIGTADVPEAFDWQAYAASHPDVAGLTDGLAALDHLVAGGIEDAEAIPLRGEGAAGFLHALATTLWARPARGPALRVMARALRIEADNGSWHGTYATWLEAFGKLDAAERHDRTAWDKGYRSVAFVDMSARFAARRGDFEAAYDRLRQTREAFGGYAVWMKTLLATIEGHFAAKALEALQFYRSGQRATGDDGLSAALEAITRALETLDFLPAPLPPAPNGHVVLFANHGLVQCRHYRIEQKCRQLQHLGIPFRLFDSDHPEQAREALVGARALIVYREPAYPATIRMILHARAMGVPTFYEIDDLIFDSRHYPDSFESYGSQIPYEDYVGLLYGVPLLRFTARLCDDGITSTSSLARQLGPLTRTGTCAVVANGVDDRNERFVAAQPAVRATADDVYLFYGSGSKAHNRDFNATVGPALIEVMRLRPQVKLVLVGHLDLDPAFEAVSGRIVRYGFTSDLDAYWSLLSEIDINLAVLVPGPMSDGKSEIKWLEAAVAGVPSVVSATATYRELLEDGEEAVLVADEAGWRDAIVRLVDDPVLRQAIGACARRRVLRDYGLPATSLRLAAALDAASSRQARLWGPPREAPKLRLLIVHVLFPPQTLGGATRVVRDNVDDLLKDHADRIEVAVFTSDFLAPKGSSRVDAYGAVPVFRYGSNSQSAFHYRDEETADHFERVLDLWKPDLVHVHCIQHLAASIVERCHLRSVPYLVTMHDAWWISTHQFLVDGDFFLRRPTARGVADAPDPATALADIARKRFLADRLNEAAALTAVSESFARLYRAAGFNRVTAIPNGLSRSFMAARAPRPARAANAKVRLGHVGGLLPHKGVHLLRAALEHGGFETFEAVVIDHAETASHERHETWGKTPVTIRGTVAQADVIALYRSFDVLIAPSIWPESFGLVSREALALGLWVVVGDLGALREGVVEGENGFVVDVADASGLIRVLDVMEAEPARFLHPPALAFEPRATADQTRDFVALYEDMIAVRRDRTAGARDGGL